MLAARSRAPLPQPVAGISLKNLSKVLHMAGARALQRRRRQVQAPPGHTTTTPPLMPPRSRRRLILLPTETDDVIELSAEGTHPEALCLVIEASEQKRAKGGKNAKGGAARCVRAALRLMSIDDDDEVGPEEGMAYEVRFPRTPSLARAARRKAAAAASRAAAAPLCRAGTQKPHASSPATRPARPARTCAPSCWRPRCARWRAWRRTSPRRSSRASWSCGCRPPGLPSRCRATWPLASFSSGSVRPPPAARCAAHALPVDTPPATLAIEAKPWKTLQNPAKT